MTLPTLLVGLTNPERDTEIAAAYTRMTIAELAAHFHCSSSTIRAAVGRHNARREFELFLEDATPPTVRVRVCRVVTTKPFVAAAVAAYRAYPATLKKLEIPGWTLTDDHHRVAISDLQQALRPKSGNPGAGKARAVSRARLGMEA